MSTTQTSGGAVQSSTVLAKVQRSILPIAFLLYMFNYMDRAAIGYAQLEMSSDLGISLATYGTVAAIFFVAYTLARIYVRDAVPTEQRSMRFRSLLRTSTYFSKLATPPSEWDGG